MTRFTILDQRFYTFWELLWSFTFFQKAMNNQPLLKFRLLFLILVLPNLPLMGQENNTDEVYYEDIAKDPSLEGQQAFVSELLYNAGYVPEKIVIYQTLANNARVYHVTLDSVTGGFIFVRWDIAQKEHYVANKMIDPGLYYNLKAAREIMRKQTRYANFKVDDVSLQASDQEKLTGEEVLELREQYQLNQETKELEQRESLKTQQEKEQRKLERKSVKKKQP